MKCGLDLTRSPSTIESQVEILRSRRIAERVLRASEAPLPLLKGEKADNETTRRTAFERSLRDVMRGITAERQGLSYVVDVSFRAADRERAAQIANALADAFVADQYEQKEKLTREAGERLKAVIAKTDAELATTEAQIRNHRGDRLAGESNESSAKGPAR